jgi:hypothetical protein
VSAEHCLRRCRLSQFDINILASVLQNVYMDCRKVVTEFEASSGDFNPFDSMVEKTRKIELIRCYHGPILQCNMQGIAHSTDHGSD